MRRGEWRLGQGGTGADLSLSGSCFTFSDFPTGVLRLPLKTHLEGRQEQCSSLSLQPHPNPQPENSQAEVPTSDTKDNAADTETRLRRKRKRLVTQPGPRQALTELATPGPELQGATVIKD